MAIDAPSRFYLLCGALLRVLPLVRLALGAAALRTPVRRVLLLSGHVAVGVKLEPAQAQALLLQLDKLDKLDSLKNLADGSPSAGAAALVNADENLFDAAPAQARYAPYAPCPPPLHPLPSAPPPLP